MPKETTKPSDPLEAKPPEIVQKIKWLKLYGWRYRWNVSISAIIVVIVFVAGGWLASGGWSTLFSTQETAKPVANNLPNQLVKGDAAPSNATDAPSTKQNGQLDPIPPAQPNTTSAGKTFLDTDEHPDEIMEALDDFVGSRRDESAKELYENRWVRDPGWLGIVFGLPNQLEFDKDWLVSVKMIRRGSDSATSDRLTHLKTEMDASHVRPGMRLRFTGRISDVSILGLKLDSVEFDIVEADGK